MVNKNYLAGRNFEYKVKNFFKEKKASGEARIKTKKPLVPSEEEVKINPKSRSARLRVLIKI